MYSYASISSLVLCRIDYILLLIEDSRLLVFEAVWGIHSSRGGIGMMRLDAWGLAMMVMVGVEVLLMLGSRSFRVGFWLLLFEEGDLARWRPGTRIPET